MSSPELRIVGSFLDNPDSDFGGAVLLVLVGASRFYYGASISARLDKSRAAIFTGLVNPHATAASFWCFIFVH
jgi:hypothetical protein